jgi:hypothetical protein
MRTELGATGTSVLLEQLSPFIPDDFINELLPRHSGRGRPPGWSSAQLYRLLLLPLLTPAHSFNLMMRMLPEQRSWRRFARLPNRYRLPVVSQLHDFRQVFGTGGLRRVNEFLIGPLLESALPNRKTVGLIDATDLKAATSDYKKNQMAASLHEVPLSEPGQSRPAKAGGLLATRSTHCVCGYNSARIRCC